MSVTVTNITGYTQCSTEITMNIWCPAPPKFPTSIGCGKLIQSLGITFTGSSTMSDVFTKINQVKNVQAKCPYCNYMFKPIEVYV